MHTNPLYVFTLFLFLFQLSIQKDQSTFSNYDQIIQKKIESHYDINFDKKIVFGRIKYYFEALEDGEVIVLDTQNLIIKTIYDCDTGEAIPFKHDERGEIKPLGTPLKIYLPYKKSEKVTIIINYETTSKGDAIDWNDKEQTAGKELPFMFTQGEPIKMRAFLPIQDTPSAKFVCFTAMRVKKEFVAVTSGIPLSTVYDGDYATFYYEQEVPIPSYLIAVAAGAIRNRTISDRVVIYGEEEIVEKAAKEFEHIEDYIQILESYLTPYEWGMYNLIILPPSFPFGGMENPCLTFVTPSIVAGDKSMVNVVAHEIGHSWMGNLVTMKTWGDLWLNEGFTVYLERKVGLLMDGEDFMKQASQLGLRELQNDVDNLGPNHEYTKLRYEIYYKDPDDAFNTVTYEKGYNFLYYIEQIIKQYQIFTKSTIDIFQNILIDWVEKYKYQTIDTEVWKNFLYEEMIIYMGQEAAEHAYKKIDWDHWLYATGMPKYKNDFENKLSEECENRAKEFFEEKLPSEFIEIFKNWHTNSKIYFLNKIQEDERGAKLNDNQYIMLKDTLDLKKGYNALINHNFFKIMLLNKKEDPDDLKYLEEFLSSQGRLSYIKPLYIALAKFDKPKAMEIFNKNKGFYNPIAARLISEELKKII